MDEYRDKFQFPYVALFPLSIAMIDIIKLSKNGQLFAKENSLSLWIDGILVALILFFMITNLAGFDYFKLSKDDIIVCRVFIIQKFSIADYKNFRIRKYGGERCIVANKRSSGKIKIILTQSRTPVKLEYLLERIKNQENLYKQ